MNQLHAVLWDMDGTLVETESLWKKSERSTMAHFGQEWSKADERDATGGPFERVAQVMADRAGVEIAEINTILDSTIQDLFRNNPIELQPGVATLIVQMRDANLPLALVSNSYRALVDIIHGRVDVEFELTIAGDEVPEPKPSPGPYLAAAAKLNVNIRNCVVIEDSEPGVASAIASGAAVIAIRDELDIPTGPRIRVVQSLAELTLADLQILVAN